MDKLKLLKSINDAARVNDEGGRFKDIKELHAALKKAFPGMRVKQENKTTVSVLTGDLTVDYGVVLRWYPTNGFYSISVLIGPEGDAVEKVARKYRLSEVKSGLGQVRYTDPRNNPIDMSDLKTIMKSLKEA